MNFNRRKAINICYHYHNLRFLSQLKKIYSMENKKIVVQYNSDAERLDLSFRFANPSYRIDRVFNFNRNCSEKVDELLQRISFNIQKIIAKKHKNSDCDTSVKVVVVPNGEINNTLESKALTNFDIFVNGFTSYSLLVADHLYAIDYNPPSVHSVKLPKCIMTGYYMFPKVELKNSALDTCKFLWFVSNAKFDSSEAASSKRNSISWDVIFDGFLFEVPSSCDGKLLKLQVIPADGERQGEAAEIIADNIISVGPELSPIKKRLSFCEKLTCTNSIRVVCYNLLADIYADSDHSRSYLFPYCPPHVLSIDYRKQLFIKEIIGYSGDLICLEEVDEKIFNHHLKPALHFSGVEGVFSSKGGQVCEGTAIFYRSNKFKLLNHKCFLLSDEIQNNIVFEDIWKTIANNLSLTETMAARTTKLQIAVLESLTVPSKIVIVGVTHLFFHPCADHIRLLQAGICMRLLSEILALTELENLDKDVSLIFCGDFNSTPEFEVYRFLLSQYISIDDIDWSLKPEEKVTGIEFSHNLHMESACGIPLYTNYTAGFNGCLDYIYYQADKFLVKQVVNGQ